jgi:hypothetical protein
MAHWWRLSVDGNSGQSFVHITSHTHQQCLGDQGGKNWRRGNGRQHAEDTIADLASREKVFLSRCCAAGFPSCGWKEEENVNEVVGFSKKCVKLESRRGETWGSHQLLPLPRPEGLHPWQLPPPLARCKAPLRIPCLSRKPRLLKNSRLPVSAGLTSPVKPWMVARRFSEHPLRTTARLLVREKGRG